ncbi:MAG TPA: outer membrane beta-barrel protein [Pyrinomonadaceae bacterium]|nr:outer membrane beta-barrel protein [Pyrinomonadaceae bacterium]
MKLRHVVLLTLLFTCCTSLSLAQSDESKVEVFVGASALAAQNALTNKDIITFDGITPAQFRSIAGFELLDPDRYIPAYGFEANVTRYFSKHVGISGDVSGYYKRGRNFRIADTLFKANHSIYHFLAGPKVKFLNEHRANVFLHALGGVARTSVSYTEASVSNPITAKDSSTRVAFALGGGVDIRVSNRISARVFQLDWIPMLGKDRRVTASDGTVVDIMGRAQQGNFRLSAGIVIR